MITTTTQRDHSATRDGYQVTQYSCAVMLIISSIVLAFITAMDAKDINNGILLYIAQAFLLAGSIFGLDYYVRRLTHDYNNSTRNPK
ncbi:MAG: hypothetical protein II261_00015 [Bacteroidaceae bacterium]|nr:hypothetical protein [Bacteroidaceae bacterium]